MTLLMCACLATAGSVAGAQSLLAKAAERRVDVVMLGDSNQLFGGHGFEHGWNKALSERFGLYATGIHWLGENWGSGNGVGYACNTLSNASAGVFQYGASPFAPDPLNPFGTDLRPCNVIMLLSGSSLTSVGMTLHSAGPYFNAGDRVRFACIYRTLGPGVSLRPLIRLSFPPYTVFSQLAEVGHSPEVREAAVEYTTQSTDGLDFKVGNFTVAPYEIYFAHGQNMDRQRGAAGSTLYAFGGQSARDAAGTMALATDELLGKYFGTIRERQHAPSAKILVRLAFGLNDRNETVPSIRENFPGATPEAFVDNLAYIIERVRHVFVANGWSTDEVEFLLSMPAPISFPNDEVLTSYELAAETLRSPTVHVLTLSSMITEPEMTAAGYYAGANDHDHLSLAGYEALAGAEVARLLAGPCLADFNGDGGVDGDDVIAYFAMWDSGLLPADQNMDRAVDGDDVILFFGRWDAGC